MTKAIAERRAPSRGGKTDIAQRERLPALIDLVAGLKASLPPYDMWNTAPYNRALDAVCMALIAKGAFFGQSAGASTFRFGGVRASATAGRHIAISNWLKAARSKVQP